MSNFAGMKWWFYIGNVLLVAVLVGCNTPPPVGHPLLEGEGTYRTNMTNKTNRTMKTTRILTLFALLLVAGGTMKAQLRIDWQDLMNQQDLPQQTMVSL